MACIFCFLEDSYQRELRRLSQIQEDRFEKILTKYSEMFISDFKESLENGICKKHKNKIYQENDIVTILKTITEQDLKDTFKIFIEDVYQNWISGNSYLAVQALDHFIKWRGLHSKRFSININEQLFYRGRTHGNNIFNTYDMFHIPYDKRYLINNQRFSLSGHPLLYLGASIEGVVKEIGFDTNSVESLKKISFSYFYFKEEGYDIYSLRNQFYFYYNENIKKEVKFIFEKEVDQKTIKQNLTHLILASLCCFEKRIQHQLKERNGSYIFYEEYVIPQALTQALKLLKKNGILFPSTRFQHINLDIDNISLYSLAIFTEYNKERHYDRELYKRLIISNPIYFDHIEEFTLDEEKLKSLKNKLTNKLNEVTKNYKLENISILTKLLKTYEKLNDKIKEKKEKEKFEKIEEFLMYNFILRTFLELK